ncbi:hypothetical protein LDENG_00125800 [Lucifuga dentata]|nr:hypothetical protein LDENG_00125800 [Lucifuga dentata]
MSRDRFMAIRWSLHLCDPETDEQNQTKKGTDQYDPLVKIKPLYDELLSSCKRFYQPHRHIAIDERMVAVKAPIGLKQHMKRKLTNWRYKLFVLADSLSGYTWNFFVCLGKRGQVSKKALSYECVMSLLDLPRLGTGYRLCDNFHTSGFPDTAGNDMPKRAERGTIQWKRKDGLLFLKCTDSREVTNCSTCHRAGNAVKRRMTDSRGVCMSESDPVPEAVQKHMGGVDLPDSFIAHYYGLHRTNKWYKALFQHFLDIAIVNAFTLHKDVQKAKKDMTQKAFRDELVQQLAELAKPEAPSQSLPQQQGCLPEFFGQDKTQGRRKCVHCRAKTPVYCTSCRVALCFVVGRNCFKEWHQK